MPKVIVYVGATHARRIAEQGHDLGRHVRDIVRLALEREQREQSERTAATPSVDRSEVNPDPK
jgi:hypothetical protein